MKSLILAALMVLAALLAGGGSSLAQSRSAAFVAEFESGEVLHARQADALRYPASLTKMMTLYLLFEALADDQVALSDVMTTSAEAASRPASDLGLEVGDTLTVEQAIRALVIRSANDAAVVIAEHLAGTEAAFAAIMTERAQALGMTHTTFRNASGLPDSGQQTTARDMARLAYALHRDFPQFYGYFSERSFTYAGRTWRSHNSLVGRVPGVDGLKTGYIDASGFNIVVSAERDGHRLVAVVMGGRTASVRDAFAEDLIEVAYTTLDARRDGILLASLNTPRLNPVREQEILTAELRGMAGPVAMGSAEAAPGLTIVMEDADALPAAHARPATETLAHAIDGLRGEAELAPSTSFTALPDTALTPALEAPRWAVQVGAYTSQAAAQARLESVASVSAAADLDNALQVTEPVERDGRMLWRARFEVEAPEIARRICDRLARLGEPCFAVSPNA